MPAYPDQFAIPPNDAAWLLRRLLRNPNAQWNSDEQVAAIIAMVRSDRDLCIIVRTGGGKTLIAVIPSFVEDGVTIIVVPFRALLRDWVRRLKDQSVPFEIFENSKSHLTGTKKIILVSVDVARLAGWRDALLRLQERGVLFLRIVIDEAHRIKNVDSILSQIVRSFMSHGRLLITGTPLQNKMKELFALLNFICPEIFSDYADLESFLHEDDAEAEGDEEKSKKVVEALHKILRPFLLRRVKSDVEKNLLASKFNTHPHQG